MNPSTTAWVIAFWLISSQRSSQLLQLHSSSQPMEGDEGAGCDPLRVHVTLPSGRGADLWLRPSATCLGE